MNSIIVSEKRYSNNPKAVSSRLFRERHPTYNRDRQRKIRVDQPDYYRKRNKEARRANPEKQLWKAALQRAKEKGLAFNIRVEDISIPDRCPVLGVKLEIKGGKRTWTSPSLDRINPSKGYVKGNIIVVSWRVNDLKRDATINDLRKIVEFYEGLL